ncbi:hypothetical protein Lalb_Chr01g0017131 [Lupinus albus]|uniref:Late nodulin n=1 Tax=Lupinus albus TaxID=3870 RepID=A0A6A4R6W6_LUPAL|nr:hypothetical protein Lalb_Chr01g0017131 [Lupinus albus]
MKNSSFMLAFLIALVAVNLVHGSVLNSEEVSQDQIVQCRSESDCKNYKCRFAPYPCPNLHSVCYAGVCWCSCRKGPPTPNYLLN